MLNTGKYFEEIVAMLINFRSEVQSASALGLSNINKHSENFLLRILNLTYNYELANLNKGKSNFPGLDLGDTGDSIAFQITATKKTDKIDDTLATCLKFRHYETFKHINVFILTEKQSSYTIKTDTKPHFDFSPSTNIRDINDLLKDIEHLDPIRMKAMHGYLTMELQAVIESIKVDKSAPKKSLLDITAGMAESKMSLYSLWRSTVKLTTETMVVPDIYSKLQAFFTNSALKTSYLPIFNEAFRQGQSNKQLLYLEKFQRTQVSNHFYGNAMLLEPSSITIEKANYTNNDILLNLVGEMVMLLTVVFFFSKHAKSNFEIEVTVHLETNGTVYFSPKDSLVIGHLLNAFTLESPFDMERTITNVHTSTIADLLQQVMHAFISHTPTILSSAPFLTIKRKETEFVIGNIKNELGVPDYHLR